MREATRGAVNMLVSDFDFELPRNFIATSPADPRDSAKLLYVKESGVLDQNIPYLLDLLNPGDVMVFNDTKVIPAQLKGMRGEAKVEVTLHKNVSDGVWKAFARPAKKLEEQDVLKISESFSAVVLDKEEGEVTLQFCTKGEEFYKKLNQFGSPPLPPYIERDDGAKPSDASDYQTVYAKNRGAVAAPTAGLHFTDELLEKIKAKGVKIAFTTLHVGAGTFLPMKVENTKDHKMHSELCIISQETADIINDVRASGGRVIAVGTTAMRLLETVADEKGNLKKFEGETDIFITPGYKFKIIDCLLTNFHLPKSTLFMLVCAFAGMEKMKAAYAHAIEKNYRFFSYGDACFLENSAKAQGRKAQK
ncbi:MAG: S-adenosylmethionine:tRNA ribosyltransferase-isomerase [Rickettsiaceae bacterium]|jgi:S-adenosylmethionine:tRNA ribosyltransferase-isomerase|nr:S-adenosylmethionine:tRNA ribosyltransferase-isomerase [Rickettsiaceae bacterium]